MTAPVGERSILDDYEDEQREIYDLLVSLDVDDWSRPTPAEGWDVRDSVAHLADTEEVALDTLRGGPRAFAEDVPKFTRGEDFTAAGCERGRAMEPKAVLDWWWEAAKGVRAGLAAADRDARVPWGLGMGWKAFVTARLMEHWAHALDIRAAVGRPGTDTDRLRHVAWICVSALPYGFRLAGVEPPPGHTLRFELTAPDGSTWTFGPEDATDRITGPAGQWCRRAVQRATVEESPDLVAEGPLAELAIRHARAFL